jgi:HEAT repeat protein
MTASATSPITWLRSPLDFADRADSPRTFSVTMAIPTTGDECERLLDQAAHRMRNPEARALFARELARFLGAASSVWTAERRARLRRLLQTAGDEALGPILATIIQTPRAEVVDEAEAVLTALGRESITLLRQLVDLVPRTAPPTARAALVQSLAGVRDPTAKVAIEVALNDEAPEVRDAAASALARFGAHDSLPALQRRLQRERNAVVVASLRAALEELENA